MTALTEHRYHSDERRRQLMELSMALPTLIEATQSVPEFAHLANQYEQARVEATNLLRDGFSQEQLSALGRSVPDAFNRHKEWMPPQEQQPDGQWREPSWFVTLESKLQPALTAARMLRELGYY